MKQYELVYANSAAGLSKMIEVRLNSGWDICGSHQVTTHVDPYTGEDVYMFTQAVTRTGYGRQ
jgi:hypothetical protein